MSFNITIANADYSLSGNPPLKPLIHGLDAEGLEGLWLLQDGVVGNDVPGPYADASGKGHSLTLFTNRTQPRQRSYGYEVRDVDGIILVSSIPSNLQQFTVLGAFRSLVPGGEANVFQQWFGSSDNSYPTTKTATHNNFPYPTPDIDGASVLGVGRYALFDGGADVFGATRAMLLDASGASTLDRVAMAYRVDGVANAAAHSALTGQISKITAHTQIGTYFNGAQAGHLVFGWWPNSNGRTATAINAELYAFACYSRYLTDDETSDALAAMAAICASRGVTINGA